MVSAAVCSVVVYSLFIVAPIVRDGSLFCYAVLCVSFAITFIVFLVPCGCYCSLPYHSVANYMDHKRAKFTKW